MAETVIPIPKALFEAIVDGLMKAAEDYHRDDEEGNGKHARAVKAVRDALRQLAHEGLHPHQASIDQVLKIRKVLIRKERMQ